MNKKFCVSVTLLHQNSMFLQLNLGAESQERLNTSAFPQRAAGFTNATLPSSPWATAQHFDEHL